MAKFQLKYILKLDSSEESTNGFVTVTIQPPFSIDFDATRNPMSGISNCSVKIYNLSADTRNRLYKVQYDTGIRRMCELRAGYEDSSSAMSLIFKGYISRCYSVRQGTDYITSVEMYDGAFAIMNSDSSHEIPAGTLKKDMIDIIAKDLEGINKRIIGKADGTISRPMPVSGKTMEILKGLAKDYTPPKRAYVELGDFYFMDDEETVLGNVGVLNSDSGLIGTPIKEGTIVSCEMIFEPRLVIAQKIELQSTTEALFNGVYKIISLHHRGNISKGVASKVTTTIGLWTGSKEEKVINGYAVSV